MTYEIKDSGNRRAFETGSVRDMAEGKGRYDLIPPEAVRRLAVHYEKGAVKYGDRNWQKGQPIHVYADSMLRHAQKVLARFEDEDHLAAVMWNAAAIIYTREAIRNGDLPESLEDLFTDKEFEAFYGRTRIDAAHQCEDNPVAKDGPSVDFPRLYSENPSVEFPIPCYDLLAFHPYLPEGTVIIFEGGVVGMLGPKAEIRGVCLARHSFGGSWGHSAVGFLSHMVSGFIEPTEEDLATYREWLREGGAK